MKSILWSALTLTLLTGCREQSETITNGTQADETFFVAHKQAHMRVTVRGNTASRTFILILHGGPGIPVTIYQTKAMRSFVESQYAVIYFDQRNAGSSQGGANLKPQQTIPQYIEDTETVVQVIRHRYGADIRLFLLSDSWGGIWGPTFLARNQALFRGWINSTGSFDVKFTCQSARNVLLPFGKEQIRLGKHVTGWQEVVSYCEQHPEIDTHEEVWQINYYANQSRTWLDEVNSYNSIDLLSDRGRNEQAPIVSTYLNLQYYDDINRPLMREVSEYSSRSDLPKITVPTLALFGKYDFVVPEAVADEALRLIKSTNKQKIVLPRSAHGPHLSEPEAYARAVADFVGRVP